MIAHTKINIAIALLALGLGACAIKKRYKTRLCQSLPATGARAGSLAACVGDARFSGKILRDNATN